MNQTSPAFRAPPSQRHSRTSRAAAITVAQKAPSKRAQVLAFLRERGVRGATDEQMQSLIPMSPNTQRPRRIELVQAGQVRDSGRTRTTTGGDQAVIWVVTPEGAAAC